ncbi:hypothetical protein [Micromonospora sp. NPDC093277]|uniref:phage tail protein n=1 Tax=Micromonospora sp. NPDC093277 TaxID=3364291 RepID=UPI003827F2D6
MASPTAQRSAKGSATTGDLASTGGALTGEAPVQRLATDAGPVRRPGPQADPKFATLKADVRGKQDLLAAHPPAKSEAAKAQGAAKPPQDDKEAQGKAANAEKMNAAKPGEFDKAAFVRAVNEAIAAQAPKNLDEADKFGDSGKADAVKGQVQGRVTDGKKASANAIETTTKAAPDTSKAVEKQVTPLVSDKPPATPGTPDPAKAVPDKAPPAATDFSDGPRQVDQQMADAQVTEEQLARSNEPEFTGALKEKNTAEQHAATAPGQVRAAEAQTLAGAKAAAGQAGAAAMTALATDRKKAGAQVGAGKEQAKSADEAKRAKVTGILQKVFDATKTDVEGILSGLDKKVDDQFSKGEKAARDAFTAEHKQRMDAYKDKRYSGLLGKGRWIKDKFAGLPEEANQIFVVARKGYVDRMQQVISAVADTIGVELGRAKQRIAAGRDELQAEVRKLPADLQAIGKEAAGEFAGKFDELTEQVNNKGTELVQTLASKYNEALKSVDEEIAAEKEKNKGLVAKAVDAVAGVIKTIMQLKDMLMGVLAKAAQAVMAIIKDPIGFLGNLVSAVGAGLKQFIANIGEHLKKGLVGWLTGAMAGAGLELPAKFDLRGIVMMIGSLLGLTWAAIRGRIVKRGVPEQAMGAVEQSVPLVQKVQAQGLGGMWEEIKEKVGDLKANLFSKISEYLIPTILMAGITWIISLLNPASAFIRAVKMIIDFVTFIVTQGAQIIEFVNSVLDAIIAIAGGGSGGVPALIEKALARSVPVLIGVLATVLGISGIAQKVQKFFKALAKPVMKAVDWVVGKIVGLGKKLWAKLKSKFAKKDKGQDGKPGTADERADIETPTRLVEPSAFHLKEPSPALSAELAHTASGQVIHQTSGDPKQVTKSVLAQHGDARYDRASKTLTLPKATVASPDSLSALGAQIAADTGVSKVSVKKSNQVVEIRGGINPETTVGVVAAPLTEQEAVRAAISEHTVIPFLEAMATGQTLAFTKDGVAGSIDLAGFEKAWKDKKLALHVKDKFRAVLDGHHEWVPSDYILEVVLKQHAANLANNGEKWIELQNKMRSNTFQVVFSPAMSPPKKVTDKLPGDAAERAYSVPNGHVGAVYYPTVTRSNQRTTGTKAFHDALRTAFESGSTPQTSAQAAHNVAKQWIWNSTPITPEIHPACQDKDGNPVTPAGQSAHAQAIEALFQQFI